MVQCVFSMPFRSLQEFIYSFCKFSQRPLSCPHYLCISQRAKTVNVTFRTNSKGNIQHLTIDSTGQRVYVKGKWSVEKHGADGKRLV